MPKLILTRTGCDPITIDAIVGESVYCAAERCGIDLDGSCGGVLACSRCYVTVDPQWYEKLDEPSEDEEDLLYICQCKSPTKRLSCQIIMTEELDGIIINIDKQ